MAGHILGFSGLRRVVLFLVLGALPESHPAKRRSRHGLVGILGVYGRILGHRGAVGYLLANATGYGGMFAFFAGSPFVYIKIYQVAPEHYGYLFACNVIALMGVSLLNARLVMRLGAHRLFALGTCLTAIGGLTLLFNAITGFDGLPGIVVPLFIYIGALA